MVNTDLQKPNPWTIIGGPSGGTASALAIALKDGHTVFVGTRTGVYRTENVHGGTPARWRRLPEAPLEIMSLAISPQYAEDRTIVAGAAQGLFISRDGGDHWQPTSTPMPNSVILSLCFSPNYGADGIIFAGTLEDGIYYSDTRGEKWFYRGFGLLDAAVYSLAISPNFARDETVFAGTETALYYSYNSARAWKQLDFPEDAAPILSLALSPDFPQDQTIYAGTESQGLYRSTDMGRSWQKLSLPAASVNVLTITPGHKSLLAATDSGLYCSDDRGETWSHLLDVPDMFSMAATDDIVVAGLVNRGAWLTSDMVNWRPFFTQPARSLTGMALSPRFNVEPVAFLYGSQEGIWRTMDGGLSWGGLNEGLPGLDIRSLAISPGFLQDRTLLVASGDGVLLSEDAGDHWSSLADTPASLITFSPGGCAIAVAFSGGEMSILETPKGPWQSVSGPWGQGGDILALAVDDDLRFRIALLDRAGESLSIWEGQPDKFEQVLSRPVGVRPVVTFWVPPQGDSDGAWYAGLDNQVWVLRRPSGKAPAYSSLIFETEDGNRIMTLTGCRSRKGLSLFACTGQTIYKSIGTKSWKPVHHFGDERAIALALSPSYSDDQTAYALLLGGAFCRGILE